MDFRPVLNMVAFAVLYPFYLVYTTVRRVLNVVLTIIARALFLDRIVNKLSAWIVRRSDLFFSRHGDPLLRGDLLVGVAVMFRQSLPQSGERPRQFGR